MTVNARSEMHSTRLRLLDAAERLFLERGYDGVSVRDITEAAGVNVASVNYHFNGKKNLYREFFRRRLSGAVERKIALLGEVIGSKDPPDLREVVRVYVSEFLGDMFSSRKAEKFMKLLTEEMSENGIATDVLFREVSAPIHRVMREAICRAVPGMPADKASLCIFSITGQMFHFVRARGIVRRITGRGYTRELVDDIVEHITEFSFKGMVNIDG
jgi:AcrR family transcriptional regulator